ncbi:MAG: HAD-IIB family hydrolase [Gammaproteobacteria bacterium]|nr:HAD-IIB family hydrolase [Gammaproteobacteria bacterium]
MLISLHGLIRSREPELGRDADTGGQVLYVLDLARSLALHVDVARVDVFTRKVTDFRIDTIYSQENEQLSDKSSIVRIECGPKRYLRKEVLWPYLDGFVDNAIKYIREKKIIPDVIHSHYADAGYIGSNLSSLLGVLHVHTGHSLGRVKYELLKKNGSTHDSIEKRYHIAQRIEAEELTLDTASLIVASTSQEINEQYKLYDNYHPQRMKVIPPGVDLTRFSHQIFHANMPNYYSQFCRFLEYPKRPMILAMSRADERKNIISLIHAYGKDSELQSMANLILILGCRERIAETESGARKVLTEVINMIDDYDLYGKVAYPKSHNNSDVPDIYQIAARTKGVFVNPALTEPFGLTLIEAAASGLPVIATNNGGPVDILNHCNNGVLIDSLDISGMSNAIKIMIRDRKRWRKYSTNGMKGTHRYYSWTGHVDSYIKEIKRLYNARSFYRRLPVKSRLPMVDRLAISAMDNSLLGDKRSLGVLISKLNSIKRMRIGFGIATGRSLDSALKELRAWEVPVPDILIVSVGSEIYYSHQGRDMVLDKAWEKHIGYRWDKETIRDVLKNISGLRYRGKQAQGDYKISYYVNPVKAPSLSEIKRYLRQRDLHVNVIFSNGINLDVLPIRASKGLAVRYLSMKWGIPLDQIFTVGDSGNDEGMISGGTLSVVVSNHGQELDRFRNTPRIYFSDKEYAAGIMDGLENYKFLDKDSFLNDQYECYVDNSSESSHSSTSGL